MLTTTAINTGILVAVAVVLVLAAIEDMRTRRISNRLSLIILGLFLLKAVSDIVSGQEISAALTWPLAVGGSVLLVGLAFFALNMMGGGDVKLLSATALFAGPEIGLSFVLYVTILGALVTLTLLAWNQIKKSASEHANKVPYGVAISLGGLWVCFHQFTALSI